MGWRDSYNALLELFPQVDSRLIKGAALEHGDDVASAAEFILNEVLVQDDVNLSNEQQGVLNTASNNSPESNVGSRDQSVATASNRGPVATASNRGQSVAATSLETSTDSFLRRFVGGTSEGNILKDSLSSLMTQDEQYQTVDNCQSVNPVCWNADSREDHVHGNQEQLERPLRNEMQEMLGQLKGVTEDIEGVEGEIRGTLGPREEEFEYGCSTRANAGEINFQDTPDVAIDCDSEAVHTNDHRLTLCEDEIPGICADLLRDVIQDVQSVMEVPESPVIVCSEEGKWSEAGFADTMSHVLEQLDRSDGLNTGGLALTSHSFCEGSVVTELEALNVKEICSNEYDELEHLVVENGITSGFEQKSLCTSKAVRDGCLDSVLSIEKSFTTVDGMDGAEWESVHCSPLQATLNESLDELVEEAKRGKEVLITTIQEIRALRLKTDQAEYSARQANDEAAVGGLDVMAKVDEMRQMLARAQEANAVHASEIYGEKAVLATEARELRSRLVQVKAEKAKALSVLNEIKASLHARINNAIHERGVAEHEKASKEIVAREVLAKEEALLSKVAQESRDLDAEAEVCTKLQESLIEHGSIVDALQGEVAVLCEDAEALKKDLDGMLLSCSGGLVHMLSRTGSDTHNGVNSTRSGKLSKLNCQTCENLIQNGDVGSDSNSLSHRVLAIQKVASDKESWSPLPSLLRSLSGSQELSSSSHSPYSSTASNSLSSSRIGVEAMGNCRDLEIGTEALTKDTKYPSLPNSPGVVTRAERELYEAQMAVFQGQESQLEYSGKYNLDIFRSEKPAGLTVGTDDEDWQVLDPVTSCKGSSGSSSRSCTGK